jgi:transposase
MPDTDLLRLSVPELAALFGNDVEALQRYRMLVALLREGRPTSEVARAFGVSRESLRRLRRAYAGGDLDALRSKRRGGGHFARGSPLARALHEEIGADPGVSAATLWRRVQERLAAEGKQAPRSTFYRLLTRLRGDDEGEGDVRSAHRLLRDSLGGLLEDPPVTLGRSALAELLLAEERDPVQRGRRLASAFRMAIARTRPENPSDRDDSRLRHYAILSGEYLEGRERAELEVELALSASTYSRAKREAIERIRALLPRALDEQEQPSAFDLRVLQDTAAELALLLSPEVIERLSPDQRAAALDMLTPIGGLLDALRRVVGRDQES